MHYMYASMYTRVPETISVACICFTNKGHIMHLLIPCQHCNQRETQQAGRGGLMPGPCPHLAGPGGLGASQLATASVWTRESERVSLQSQCT